MKTTPATVPSLEVSNTMTEPLTLYRVGVPSIGEVYQRRFTYSRSSGGLGTGVYAFRDRQPAKSNISRSSPEDDLFVLEDALENPVQPTTSDATYQLVRLSRMYDLLRIQHEAGSYTYEKAVERGPIESVSLSGGLTGDPGWGEGSQAIGNPLREVLFNTPELRDLFGYDTDEFHEAWVDATRAAANQSGDSRTWVQPINKLLWPEHDGVAPLDGAGGNSGRDGCVVFKQKVDDCVGRTTESFEEVSADRLNQCWADSPAGGG